MQSADLFHSSSVLAYICNTNTFQSCRLQSHYCNTLQSPIVLFALYLYCRVRLAFLHHIEGVGLGRQRGQQAANLLAKMAWNPPDIIENLRESKKIASLAIVAIGIKG